MHKTTPTSKQIQKLTPWIGRNVSAKVIKLPKTNTFFFGEIGLGKDFLGSNRKAWK